MNRRLATLLCWLASASLLRAADDLWSEPFGEFAFVPRPRQFRVTPIYTYSRADNFFAGNGQQISLPQTAARNSGLILTEYAFRQYLAADLTTGFVEAHGLGLSTSGLADTQFGLRWRLLDEDLKESEPYVPTLTLRLGGIVHGTYRANQFLAPGVGACGLEPRLLLSDTIGQTGFSLFGDFGWRWFANDVPQQFFGSAGAGYSLHFDGAIRSLTANVGYVFNHSLSGEDLFALPPRDWAQLRALSRAVEAGLAAVDRHGRRYQIFISAELDGENAARAMTVGAYVRFPFRPLPRPEDD